MSEFLLTELTAEQGTRIDVLLDALRRVPALADRYRSAGTVTTAEDLAAVPVLAKDDLQVALAHLRPRARSGATWVFQSGGSTGAPQLGYAPSGLYMADVFEQWQALDRDDIFVNAWNAGKMWGAHFLVNAYVDHTGCVAMNLGGISGNEYDPWLRFFADQRVTAFGGTPSVLRTLFGHARRTGVTLPDLRKVLWLGEAWDSQLDADLRAVAPQAARWGMFGSTETWVIGTNTPQCPADCWHPLPRQLVGIDEDGMLDFTSLHPEVLNPVLRYRTGDAGERVACPCGRPGSAFRVWGRRDRLIKFRGCLLDVDDLLATVSRRPGVAQAQLVVHEHTLGDQLEVRLMADGRAGPELATEVRAQIVEAAFGPSDMFLEHPDSLAVQVVESLVANERTGKVAQLVVRSQR